MSILAYTGLPGSGKSYNAVANVIIPALEKGRRVVTNIPMNADAIAAAGYGGQLIQFSREDYDSEDFIAEWVAPHHGAVFVLDEVWRLWPAGLIQSKMPQDQQSWLAEHRHHNGPEGYTDEIVLVTQRLAQIAMSVRSLVETQYQHVKLTKAGMTKRFTVKVFSGGDTNPRQADIINQLYGKYDKRIFAFYESHTQKKGHDSALESKADGRDSIFRSPKFIAAAIFAVLAPIGGIYAVGHSLEGLAGNASDSVDNVTTGVRGGIEERSESMPPRMPESSRPGVVAEQPRPPLSKRWRIGGYFQRDDSVLVYLVDAFGQSRRVSTGCDLALEEVECVIDGERITEYSGSIGGRAGYLGNATNAWQSHVTGQ